jgi:hypothetical protein
MQRALYIADLRCIECWRQLHNTSGIEGVRSYVHDSLQKMFPLEHIPAPYLDAFVDHHDGWHLVDYGATQRNITIDSICGWAAAPLGKGRNLCLVGEAYYKINPGWTAGAFMTAHRCIKQQFRGVLSGAALAAADFVSTGCGGRRRFANEVILLKNVSGPGLNPATCRRLEE